MPVEESCLALQVEPQQTVTLQGKTAWAERILARCAVAIGQELSHSLTANRALALSADIEQTEHRHTPSRHLLQQRAWNVV